jgi:cytochrome P450
MIYDLFGSPEVLSSPFDYLQTLRDDAPVFFSETLNAFVVTRFEDVKYVLNTPQLFSSYPAATAQTSAGFASQYASIYEDVGTYPPLPTLVVTDGDVHRRYRAIIEKAFAPAAVKLMEDKVRSTVHALVDVFAGAGKVDLYAELCLKLPSFVMCDVLGFPREAAPLLKRGADTSPRLTSGALESEETRRDLHRQRAEMYVFIQRYIERYRASPESNLLSEIIHAPTSDAVPLTERELVSIAATLNVGGNETTVNGLGNMFYVALETPGMMARLRANRQDIPRLIDESLRLESAVSAMPRRVVQSTVLNGVVLPGGAALFVSFAGANRDDRQFLCPNEVDLARKGLRNHLAFGMGPHYCAGVTLARLEMKIAMEVVLERLQDIRLDGPIRHQGKLVVHGVEALPIAFAAAGEAA